MLQHRWRVLWAGGTVVALLLGACSQQFDPVAEDARDIVESVSSVQLTMFDLRNPMQIEAAVASVPKHEALIRARAAVATDAERSLSQQAIPYCDLTASLHTSWWSGMKYGRGYLRCNTAFLEAELSAEVFNHTNGDGDIKGTTCWAQSTCARNSGAIPTYAGHNYCAYSQVVVFGGTWGGAGSASTPGCY